MIYKESYKIRGHEIDQHYLLNPLFIIHYFHDCYANYCTDMGLAAFDLQKEGKTWIMSEMKADITEHMPRWREVIDVETWTYKMNGLRTEQNFRITFNNSLIAKGTSRWVVIDEKNRKAVKHEESVKKMKCHSEEVYENFHFKKIQLPNSYQFEETDKIRTDEVDFNQHLNSIRYIVRALDLLPQSYKMKHTLSSLHAKYTKEILAGETVKTKAEPLENKVFHLMKNKNDEELFRMMTEWK